MSEEWEEIVNQPLPRYTKEDPIVGRWWLLEQGEHPKPETELQALMEAAPHETPAISQEAQQFQNETIINLVENFLSEEERAVIEVTIYAGHSIRRAAEILGWPKTTVHRLQESALRTLERIIRDGLQDT